MKKILLILILLTSLTGTFLFVPFVVSYATGNPQNFDYYIQALSYMAQGLGTTLNYMLKTYAKFIQGVIEIFKLAAGL